LETKSPIERLNDAGWDFSRTPQGQREILETLSGEEIDVLISLRARLQEQSSDKLDEPVRPQQIGNCIF
jgi:hypothetical protein